MKIALGIIVIVLLSGCAQYGAGSNSYGGYDLAASVASNNYDIEADRLEKMQLAGEITQLELSRGLFSAHERYIPDETIYGLYLANRIDLATRLDRKEITTEQFAATNRILFAEYKDRVAQTNAQRQAEYNARAQAQNYYRAAMGAQIINNMNQNYQRGMRPITPMVNCTSTGLGGVVSTTCY